VEKERKEKENKGDQRTIGWLANQEGNRERKGRRVNLRITLNSIVVSGKKLILSTCSSRHLRMNGSYLV